MSVVAISMGEEVISLFHSLSLRFLIEFIVFMFLKCSFCVALDSDDLLYLKEQMEAEQDAERLLRRTEKRAFAAFKISFVPVWHIAKYYWVNLLVTLKISLYSQITGNSSSTCI